MQGLGQGVGYDQEAPRGSAHAGLQSQQEVSESGGAHVGTITCDWVLTTPCMNPSPVILPQPVWGVRGSGGWRWPGFTSRALEVMVSLGSGTILSGSELVY